MIFKKIQHIARDFLLDFSMAILMVHLISPFLAEAKYMQWMSDFFLKHKILFSVVLDIMELYRQQYMIVN